jgi:hypothetical protein
MTRGQRSWMTVLFFAASNNRSRLRRGEVDTEGSVVCTTSIMGICFNRYLTFVQPSSHIVCQKCTAVGRTLLKTIGNNSDKFVEFDRSASLA